MDKIESHPAFYFLFKNSFFFHKYVTNGKMQSLLLFDANFSFILDFVNNINCISAKQLQVQRNWPFFRSSTADLWIERHVL